MAAADGAAVDADEVAALSAPRRRLWDELGPVFSAAIEARTLASLRDVLGRCGRCGRAGHEGACGSA